MITIPMNDNIIFELNYEESRKAIKWIKRHNEECKLSKINKISYLFTPINSDIIPSVKCDCGESFILTTTYKLYQ